MRKQLIPVKSMIQTSIGNAGMVLHCAPLLLNTGWTENKHILYKYYYDGITPSVERVMQKIDQERVLVSKKLGFELETTQAWLKRTYGIEQHVNDPYSLDGFYIIFAAGFLPTPYLWGEIDEFKHSTQWKTKSQNGGVVIADRENNAIDSERVIEYDRQNIKEFRIH